jgi:putative redox protein
MSADAARGTCVFVSGTGLGRFQGVARTASGALVVDEPAADGGLGSGPNPYDLLSAALGACTTMTLSLYADLKGFPLQRVEVCVEHRRAMPDGRDLFIRSIRLVGMLDDGQRARLLEIAKRCPVHRTLERGAEIQTALVTALEVDAALEPVSAHWTDMQTASH